MYLPPLGIDLREYSLELVRISEVRILNGNAHDAKGSGTK